MYEIDCLGFAWAPATGLADWFAAAGLDDPAPAAGSDADTRRGPGAGAPGED